MALAERTRAARDLRWAAKGCGLPRAVWEPLTGSSSRRVLDLVAQQCASSGAAPGLKANRARSLGNMVASMPKRVAMCLERKGAMTEY